MLSDFSPILAYCSGRSERLTNSTLKKGLFRAECSEIAEQDIIAQ